MIWFVWTTSDLVQNDTFDLTLQKNTTSSFESGDSKNRTFVFTTVITSRCLLLRDSLSPQCIESSGKLFEVENLTANERSLHLVIQKDVCIVQLHVTALKSRTQKNGRPQGETKLWKPTYCDIMAISGIENSCFFQEIKYIQTPTKARFVVESFCLCATWWTLSFK